MISVGPFAKGAVMLVTPESVKQVLKTNFANYVKGPQFNEVVKDFLGNGIFNSDGAIWRLHRKVAVRMFSRNLLCEGTAIAKVQAANMVGRIEKHAAAGEPFDLQQCFYAFTMDVFTEIAFGVELNSQQRVHPFAEAFDTVQKNTNDRFQNPIWKAFRFVQTKSEREIAAGNKVMKSFAMDVINGKRREVDSSRDGGLGPDLLSRFIEKGDSTDDEMVDIVLNFLLAGRDTTASALSWTVFEMLRNPDTIVKLREEVDTVMAEHYPGVATMADLAYEDMFKMAESQLNYTRACASEGLRLHPSVPKDIKFAVKDDILPDGTPVYAGQAVCYCPYAMGRNPHLWPEPEAFKPERWTTASAAAGSAAAGEKVGGGGGGNGGGGQKASLHKPTQVSEYSYPVFNAGPRICLGRPLALLEIQLGLALLFDQFDFKHAQGVDPNDESYTQSLVCPMKYGLKVTASRRGAK